MIGNLFIGVDRRILRDLVLLHTLIIAASNYLVNFKFEVLGAPLALSTFTYPLIFVATDLTVRLLGKRTARSVISISWLPGILASIAVILLTGAPWQAALRVSLASGFSYVVATLIDVYAFAWLRERFTAWWVAPGASGIVTTIISTYIFFAAAFYQSTNAFMAENWPVVATNGIISKIIIGTIVILPAYGLLLDWLLKRMRRDDLDL